MPLSVSQIEALGGYKILLLDPPWEYTNKGRGAAANHYGTMPDADLASFPVSRIAAPNSVMFMWATWPNLPLALSTMQAFGFSYKTLGFMWIKHHEASNRPFWGGGFWSRSNSEPCLLGVRGDIRRINAGVHQLVETWGDQEDLVLRAPHPLDENGKKKHSAKPLEVRKRITRLMGDLPRLEMFGRDRAPGWDFFGNEVPGGSDIILTDD